MGKLRIFEIDAIVNSILEKIEEIITKNKHEFIKSGKSEIYLDKKLNRKEFDKKIDLYIKLLKQFNEIEKKKKDLYSELVEYELFPKAAYSYMSGFDNNVEDMDRLTKVLKKREDYLIGDKIRKEFSFPDTRKIREDIVLEGNKEISKIIEALIAKYNLK